MSKIIGAVAVLSTAIAFIFAQSTPTFADVIVNNVLSPFTAIQVGPGQRYGDSGYYERPAYYDRPAYYGGSGRFGARRGRCWVSTDRDRNYGYWDWCR